MHWNSHGIVQMLYIRNHSSTFHIHLTRHHVVGRLLVARTTTTQHLLLFHFIISSPIPLPRSCFFFVFLFCSLNFLPQFSHVLTSPMHCNLKIVLGPNDVCIRRCHSSIIFAYVDSGDFQRFCFIRKGEQLFKATLPCIWTWQTPPSLSARIRMKAKRKNETKEEKILLYQSTWGFPLPLYMLLLPLLLVQTFTFMHQKEWFNSPFNYKWESERASKQKNNTHTHTLFIYTPKWLSQTLHFMFVLSSNNFFIVFWRWALFCLQFIWLA